jgi:hypothetical protein
LSQREMNSRARLFRSEILRARARTTKVFVEIPYTFNLLTMRPP